MLAYDNINLLLDASNFEDLWSTYARLMASEGFDAILFGQARPAPGQPFRTNPSGNFLLSTLGQGYCLAYGGEKFFHSPIVKWVATHSGVILWSEFYQRRNRGELTAEELGMLEIQTSFGIRGGLTIVLGDTGPRTRAAIDLMSCRDTCGQSEIDLTWRRRGSLILVLTRVFYLKTLTVPSIVTATLTKRQREVLEWAAAGKSVQDIAALLSITRPTAEKHLRLAREMLGAETTAQAVAKALSCNLIRSGPQALLSNNHPAHRHLSIE